MSLMKKAEQYIGPAGTEKLEDNGKHIKYARLGRVDRKDFTVETNQGNFQIKVPIIGQNIGSLVLDKSKYGVSITLGTVECCIGYLSGFVIGQDEDEKFGYGMRYAQQLNLNPVDIVPVSMQDKSKTGELIIGSACSGRGVRLIVMGRYGRQISEMRDIVSTPEADDKKMYTDRFNVKKDGIFLVWPQENLAKKLGCHGVDVESTLEHLSNYERFTRGDIMKKIVASGALDPGSRRLKDYQEEIAKYDEMEETLSKQK